MNYDVDHFINKFEAIPENMWTINTQYACDTGARCAYGHCTTEDDLRRGYFNGSTTEEGIALKALTDSLKGLKRKWSAERDITPAIINNGYIVQYQQPTPKQRILAALRDIKEIQRVEKLDEALRRANEVIDTYFVPEPSYL